MQVIHEIGGASVSSEAENPCFILTNKTGGYISLSEYPISRYQGVFFNNGKEMFKTISNIFPVDSGRIKELKNSFHSVERGRKGVKETITMPLMHDSIIYELDKEMNIEIVLDAKKVNDNREFGRYYRTYEEKGKIIIEFTKKTDSREDDNDGKKEFSIFVVINNGTEYTQTGSFYEEHYSFDERRSSWPWKRHVYSALRIKAEKLVVSFSTDKRKAIEENTKLLRNLMQVKEKQKIYVNGFQKKIKDKEKMMAYKAACLSLDYLITTLDRRKGIYAGLWWFFQFWSRDELVSLKALIDQGKYDLTKDIILSSLKTIGKDGRIPVMTPLPKGSLESADAIGWLMKRVYDFIEELFRKKIITEYLQPEEIEYIKKRVEDAIYGLIDKHTNDDLALNGNLETWMDTEQGIDYRAGYRIEIQALRLNLYKLMKLLCKATNDEVGENIADKLEKDLAEKVRKEFWNRDYLDDGVNDSTIRPNVFIAYYAYPELLKKSQWIRCFRSVLPALWLEWGGISSIDKDNMLYCPIHTGQDNRSYHRGDSWFWLNNLAALCMARLSRMRFSKEINAILEASTKEILWNGAVGHHAEVSSSAVMESMGCMMQAWSAAMYIELMNELY